MKFFRKQHQHLQHLQHAPLARLIAILAAFGVLAFGVAGCGKSTEASSSGGSTSSSTTKGKAQKKSASADNDKDAENAAIEFHNDLLGLLNVSNKPLEKISKALEGAVSDARRGANPDSTRWQTLLMGDSNFSKVPGYNLTAPESFSSDDKEFFDKGIKTVRDSVGEVISIVGSLNSYYKAEDYKDDWFKKLYMSSLRFNELAAKIDETSEPLAGRINDITEEIDNRNVAKIPVGKFVLNMRAFMKKYREMTTILLRDDLVDTKYAANVSVEEKQHRLANAKPWVEKAEALTAELDKLAESQRTLTIEGFEKSEYEKMYREFYTNYDSTKGDTRRIIRELRERGVTNDQSNITNNQGNIGRVLGRFVDRWNEKGAQGK